MDERVSVSGGLLHVGQSRVVVKKKIEESKMDVRVFRMGY